MRCTNLQYAVFCRTIKYTCFAHRYKKNYNNASMKQHKALRLQIFPCSNKLYKKQNNQQSKLQNLTVNYDAIGAGFHKVQVQRTWWTVIQKNLIRIQFESHYLTGHCVICSRDQNCVQVTSLENIIRCSNVLADYKNNN